MIHSYNQELKIRARKNLIFWIVVLVFATFLHLFFQGYYINYRELIHPEMDESKKTFLKPFGIIDIHVFPSPDAIYVNERGYDNSSKTIFDLGSYVASIYKDGYLTVKFPIEITAKNPFYTNTINLLRKPEFRVMDVAFDRIEKVDDFFYADSGSGIILVFDKDFQIARALNAQSYSRLGKNYFVMGTSLFEYDYSASAFKPVLSKDKTLLSCPSWKIYAGEPYCSDTKLLVKWRALETGESVVEVNRNILVTNRYIYNQDNTYADWQYYEYRNPKIGMPDSLVHVKGVPYVVQSWSLLPLDAPIASGAVIPKIPLDSLLSAQEFNTETVFLGMKNGKGNFVIMENEKRWMGEFDLSDAKDLKDMKVGKTNGIYVFYSNKGAYVYYKGASDIFKITNTPTIALIDSVLFFRKDGKTDMIDLLRK